MPEQIINDVPAEEVGECIQLHIDAGATRAVAEANADETTFTVRIEKD